MALRARPPAFEGRPTGARVIDASWLDFKLGLRILIKYPGLTVVGGLAMAIGIAVSAAVFDVVYTRARTPAPPLHDVVAIRYTNLASGSWATPYLHDFVRWRDELETVEVAVSVAALPTGAAVAWGSFQRGKAEPGFAAHEFVSARLSMDYEIPPGGGSGDVQARTPIPFLHPLVRVHGATGFRTRHLGRDVRLAAARE